MKKLLTLFVFVLAAITAWAQDTTPVTLQDGDGGTKYVNMPVTGTSVLTLSDLSVRSFNVYDDGGASGQYSSSCNGYLLITAPEGCRLQLSGTINSELGYDYLTVYDGETTSSELLPQTCGNSQNSISNDPVDIGIVTSSDRSMLLYFNSDGGSNFDGLNLIIDVIVTTEENPITIKQGSNGVVTSNLNKAKFDETIILTETHDKGYVLDNIKVVDAKGRNINVNGGAWYSEAHTFSMPVFGVTVTPTFRAATTAADNLFIIMPQTGTLTTAIPADVKSFKIYDDAGPDGKYSDNCDGNLLITAPEGYRIQVRGTINTEKDWDYLTIYDGTTTSDVQLSKTCGESSSGISQDPLDIGTIISSSRNMLLNFCSDSGGAYDGLDLTVYVFDANAQQTISINTATGGSLSSDVSTAKFEQTVTLTETLEKGYVLESVSVVDDLGRSVEVNGGTWYSDVTSFSMPFCGVTITPTFTTPNDLYMCMPNGDNSVKTAIPVAAKTFKIYSDGGPSGNYSKSCNSSLILTAPIGYMLQLTGNMISESGYDFLTIYDGTTTAGTELLPKTCGNASSGTPNDPLDIGTINSSGRSLLLTFESDGSGNYSGLNLTATLIPITYTLAFDNGKAGATGTMDITGAMESIELTYDAPQNLPAVGFSRTAYDFTGWALTATGEVKYVDKAEVENLATEQGATVTLYGKWTPIVYPITYDLAGGALAEGVTNPVEYTIESANFTLKNPTRRGYNFAGWTGTDLTEATKTVTVTTGHYGERSYTATWTPIIYNITYDLKGGEVATANPATYTIESGAIKLNNPTRTGFTFKGWTGTDLTVATVEVTIPAESIGDRSYVATWEANPYKVSFDANGGDGGTMADQNFVYDAAQNLTANAFTRTGYIFTGWNSKADGTGTPYADKQEVENLTATRDAVVTMYAQWQPIIYYVAFDKNGGTGTDMMVQKFIYDTAQELFENAYTRKGYNFDGWNSKANGSGTPYTDKQSVKNLSATQDEVVTLYAQWNAITYTISYDLDGGSVATANPESYTIETATFTLNNPTRTGYTFKGWKGTDIDGATMTVTIAKGSTGNREYTATWERNAITLVDDADNSDLLTTWDGIVADVTLSGRTFSKNNQWNTICLPFDLTIAGSVLDGAEVRTLENSSLSELNLTLTFSDPVTEIVAGKPYVIRWTSGEPLVNPKFVGVTVNNVQSSVMTGDVEFIGTYAPTALTKDDVTNLYLGSNNTLYYPNVDGFKVNAFRAYFKVSDSLGAMGFNIIADFGDGSTTRIQNIESTGSAADSWYTLNGVKLNGKPTQKGVFIHNGKKEIVK